ncbi:MAG: NAD(P)-dependent oxidoreductase [Flavobacteriales bacterium]|nr:NAD(P)-dependent oxidoreductase [Flavobacteriales bacterium]
MKVLFLDSVHPILEEKLSASGYSCDHDYTSTREEIRNKLIDYTGLVIRSRIKLDKNILEAAPSLKWIARSGSGMENIDLAFAEMMNIRCINSPEGNADAVGEHVVGMLLMLLNKLNIANDEVKKGLWRREENRGTEISSKVFSIIGFGVMGKKLAEKLSGFGCEILAHDKYKTGFSNHFVKETALVEIFERSDFVSIHLPLNTETTHYANEKFFKSFKKSIVFINASRGKNLDTAALADALKNGHVSGACLDVIEFEKASLEGLDLNEIPSSLQTLFDSARVIFSPHIAGWTDESYYKLSYMLAEKILKEEN